MRRNRNYGGHGDYDDDDEIEEDDQEEDFPNEYVPEMREDQISDTREELTITINGVRNRTELDKDIKDADEILRAAYLRCFDDPISKEGAKLILNTRLNLCYPGVFK